MEPNDESAEASNADCIPGTRYSKYFIIHLVKELCEFYSTAQSPLSQPLFQSQSAEELTDRLDVLSQMSYSSPPVAQFLLTELRPAILFLVQTVSASQAEGDEQGMIRLARPLFAVLSKLADTVDGERDREMVSVLAVASFAALRWMDARVMVECMKILTRLVEGRELEGDREVAGMLEARLGDEDFVR